MKLDCYFIPFRKTNSEMDQRLKHKTWYHKTPWSKHEKKLFSIVLGNDFLDITQKAQTTKAKLKLFCCTEAFNTMKRHPTKWEENCANHMWDKGSIPKIYKECIQLNSSKQKTPPIKKMGIGTKHFPKTTSKCTTPTCKDAQHQYSSNEYRLKPQWGITSYLLRWLSRRQLDFWY